MVEKISDGTLAVKGRIDSSNVTDFENELLAFCNPGQDVLIDGSKLEYISSAGLRVFLKVRRKTHAQVTVFDVNRDVYDIFYVTGFTDIINVEKQLREIDVEDSEVIGEGANGKVYRLDDETIIKVFAPGVPMEVVREERDFARSAFVAGVPTAISYDVAKVGDSYGAVYEMLHAKTLSSVIMENKDRAEEMGRRMGELLKELHQTPADTSKLSNMNDVYRERVKLMEKYLTKEEYAKLSKVYEVLEDRQTLIHGDYHTKNIMYMDDELIFIDMGDVGYGHPLLDIGGSYLGMVHVGQTNPDATMKYIGMDFDTCTRVWNAMLLAYFGEKDLEEGRKLVEIYGEAKYMLTPAFYTKMTDEMAQNLINRTRANGFISDSFDITPALDVHIEF